MKKKINEIIIYLRKIITLFSSFIFAKKKWFLPNKSKIIIYDNVGSNDLIKLLEPKDYHILHVRQEIVNLVILFKSFFVKGSIYNSYVDTYIKIVDPKIIITFVDNNDNFYYLKNRHKKIEFIFIQNGWRSIYSDVFEVLDSVKIKNKKKNVCRLYVCFWE